MKKWCLVVLNISIILPCIIFKNIGTSFMKIIWLITLALSVVNVIFNHKKKDFIIYSLILLVVSSVGMYINGQLYFHSLLDKQIWYDLEGDLTYFLSIAIHLISHLIIMSIEFLLKYLFFRRKTTGI